MDDLLGFFLGMVIGAALGFGLTIREIKSECEQKGEFSIGKIAYLCTKEEIK